MADDSVLARLGRVIAPTVEFAWNWWKHLGLVVHGIEVTQGTQHFRSDQHLSGNFGADNTIRLVARKPAWVRVYVRSGLLSSTTDVTGTLEVSRRHLGTTWLPLTTLQPRPPGVVTAWEDPDYHTERSDPSATLNFVIPTEHMCGRLRLIARVTAPGGFAAEQTIEIDATLQQKLRVRGIMIGYNGPDASGTTIALPQPTLADLQRVAAWTPTVYPVAAQADLSIGGTFTHNASVAQISGGCGATQNWGGLVANYLVARAADGAKPGYVYYGLVAAGTPGADSAGCGGLDWVFSGAGEGAPIPAAWDGTWELTAETTFAHELGHHLARQHAPGLTPDPDPSYPAYQSNLAGQSYVDGSIGEYGLDVNTGDVYEPGQFADFMSYRQRRWISPYTWAALTEHPRLNPSYECVDHPPEFPIYVEKLPPFDPPKPKPWRTLRYHDVITVIGELGPTGDVQIGTMTRQRVASPLIGPRIPYVIELLDDRGEQLAAEVLRSAPSAARDEGDMEAGGSRVVYAELPDVGTGAALRVLRDGEEVWRRDAPANPPEIAEFRASLDEDGALEARWAVRADESHGLSYWLRWRRPDEQEWNGLAVGLSGEGARVDSAMLPSGQSLLQLVAHDGFSSVASEPVTLTIPTRAASAVILSPSEQQVVAAGRTLRLFGTLVGEAPEGIRSRWLIDGEEVGSGLETYVETPTPGSHRCTFEVEFAAGAGAERQMATDEVTFHTTASR